MLNWHQEKELKQVFGNIVTHDPSATWEKYKVLIEAVFNEVLNDAQTNETVVNNLPPDIIKKITNESMSVEDARNLRLASKVFSKNIDIKDNIQYEIIVNQTITLATMGLYNVFDDITKLNETIISVKLTRRLMNSSPLFKNMVDKLYRINFWTAHYNIDTYINYEGNPINLINQDLKTIKTIRDLKAHFSVRWIIGFVNRNKFGERNNPDIVDNDKITKLKRASMYNFNYVPLLYSLNVTDLTTAIKSVVLFILETINFDDLESIQFLEYLEKSDIIKDMDVVDAVIKSLERLIKLQADIISNRTAQMNADQDADQAFKNDMIKEIEWYSNEKSTLEKIKIFWDLKKKKLGGAMKKTMANRPKAKSTRTKINEVNGKTVKTTKAKSNELKGKTVKTAKVKPGGSKNTTPPS